MFLGRLERPDDVIAAVAPVVAASPALTLQLAGAGTFGGGRRRAGVCWVGVTGSTGELTDLADRLAAAVREQGLNLEHRPFRAHLTVGRWRAGDPADLAVPARLTGHAGPAWSVDRVLLLASHLGPQPGYEQLAGWPLRQA